ncbi:hypothetical protein [Vibrio sp. M260112]|uniref:hypothetical protein n=1 Tax=Vibrio sp. M260112 TaxID=3020895 RepID=UPI002F41D959
MFIGSVLSAEIDQLIAGGAGEAVLKVGSAILGAGVFAAIMKSSQFTQVFQKHIYDVFYEPSNIENGIPVIQKWKVISNALISKILPSNHEEVVEKIEQQFFSKSMDYHIEDFVSKYKLVVTDNTLSVFCTSNYKVVVSPYVDEPKLKQTLKTEAGDVKLSALRLNGVSYTNDAFVEHESDPTLRVCEIKLNDYAKHRRCSDQKTVKFERVLSWTQDLKTEPYIKAYISTYIKGATIEVKSDKGYKVIFERFGLGDLPENHYIEDTGEGYERWNLADSDHLLLPGQGYILFLVPKE